MLQSPAIEERVRQVLAGLGVPYELIPIDAAFADTASFCERYGFPLEHSVNTIIVGSKREPKQYWRLSCASDDATRRQSRGAEAHGWVAGIIRIGR